MRTILGIIVMLTAMYALVGAIVVVIHYERNKNGIRHRLFDNPMIATYYIIIWPLVLLDAEI